MIDLKDKNIIITGASQGLGAVCAKAFSEAGAKLVLASRSLENLQKTKETCFSPSNHFIVEGDLTESGMAEKLVNKSINFFGEVDCVLHVAGGGLGLHNPLIESENFLKLFELNVCVASEINRFVVPFMKKAEKGNLVHVASIAASEAIASVGYNTVKAALSAYTRSLGNELAKYNIIANGILPGGFYTPDNAMGRLKKNNIEVYNDFIENRLPRGKMGLASELVPLLAFLCSDSASMMNGSLVPIDAGEGKTFINY